MLTAEPAPVADLKPGELCRSAEYRALDFANGHFRMTASDGRLAGHLHTAPLLSGCASRGHWRGAIAGGDEVTTWFDRYQHRWHQVYINDDGHPLVMAGSMQGAALVFIGMNTFFDGRFGLHRMSWWPLPGGGLRQHGEFSEDSGATWQTLLDARGSRLAAGSAKAMSR